MPQQRTFLEQLMLASAACWRAACWGIRHPASKPRRARVAIPRKRLLGLGALINVCATLPANYIAFEYPSASEPFWNDIVTGLPPADQIVKDSHVELLPAPGLGVDIDAKAAKPFLKEEDAGFFDA